MQAALNNLSEPPPPKVNPLKGVDLSAPAGGDVHVTGGTGNASTSRAVLVSGDGSKDREASSASGAPADGIIKVDFQGAEPTEDGSVRLNFDNAEIKTVAKAVLGDVLNLNYMIDPRVTGTISLASRKPIARRDLLALIESALRATNATLVQQGSVYRILPSTESTGLGHASVGEEAAPGYGLTVLPLENISAEAVTKILEGFGARQGAVKVDTAHNLLIVQGTSAERKSLVDDAVAFDVDWMRRQSAGMFPVSNAEPEEMIEELSKVVDTSNVKLQPIPRLNAILAVAPTMDAIRRVSSWIKRFDRTDKNETGVHVYQLRYGDARKITAIVSNMFGAGSSGGSSSSDTGTAQIAPGAGLISAGAPAAPTTPGLGATSGLGATPTQATSGSKHSANQPNNQLASGDLSGANAKIRINADVSTNSIVVYASAPDYKMVEHAIMQLDKQMTSVEIEATVAEVTLNNQLQYGVQALLSSTANGNTGSLSLLTAALPLQRAIPGANLVLGADTNPHLVINALRAMTDVNVLSSPSLVVVDGEPAVLQVGDEVPVQTSVASQVTAPGAPIVQSIDFRDTGIILRVTPHIRKNSVLVDIEQEISSVVDNTNSTSLTPTISQRKVKSTINVTSGQTVLLAGLISDEHDLGKNGLPFVYDVPILGDALSQATKTHKRTELIIFIKPQIIRGSVDAQKISEEMRGRMQDFGHW
jgi:general secretion pathway protein D